MRLWKLALLTYRRCVVLGAVLHKFWLSTAYCFFHVLTFQEPCNFGIIVRVVPSLTVHSAFKWSCHVQSRGYFGLGGRQSALIVLTTMQLWKMALLIKFHCMIFGAVLHQFESGGHDADSCTHPQVNAHLNSLSLAHHAIVKKMGLLIIFDCIVLGGSFA